MKSHAEILADIAAQVVAEHRKLTLTRSGSTTDPDKGNVLVPHDCYESMCPAHRHNLKPVDPSWDYTLPEEYQA
jgi:hypothetical protein